MNMMRCMGQVTAMVDIVPTPHENAIYVLPVIGILQPDNIALHVAGHILEELKQAAASQSRANAYLAIGRSDFMLNDDIGCHGIVADKSLF
jgi:hypothetical protein